MNLLRSGDGYYIGSISIFFLYIIFFNLEKKKKSGGCFGWGVVCG